MDWKLFKGYDFFEGSSAFQKSIRRGMENDALYWGLIFFETNDMAQTYLWNRMKIMVSEDIGLAEPNLMSELLALEECFIKFKEKKTDKKASYRLFFVHAILRLVHAKKSRLVDWQLNYMWDMMIAEKPREIPDYALDIHTYRGKKMGKTKMNFLNEGSHLENAILIGAEEKIKEILRKEWSKPENEKKLSNYNKEEDAPKPIDLFNT